MINEIIHLMLRPEDPDPVNLAIARDIRPEVPVPAVDPLDPESPDEYDCENESDETSSDYSENSLNSMHTGDEYTSDDSDLLLYYPHSSESDDYDINQD